MLAKKIYITGHDSERLERLLEQPPDQIPTGYLEALRTELSGEEYFSLAVMAFCSFMQG